VRSCHLDTCPVGIATQRPELRAKFAATPAHVEAYLLHLAEDVRRHLAALGLRTFDDAVGRVECLRRREPRDEREAAVDPSPLLLRGGLGPARHEAELQIGQPGGELGERIAAGAAPALDRAALVEMDLAITNRDRAVGARLGGMIAARHGAGPLPGRVRVELTGSAGQSFGAFLARGTRLVLVGDANDGVGKSMAGGRIVVRPPEGDSGDPVLLGNAALYGATGGELFCAGRAGERFAVRNSGAVAVVEGVGAHGCEYMTAGLVVILGETGRNLAAGMSGGELVVHDPLGLLDARLNDEQVETRELDAGTGERLSVLLERHAGYTGSLRAAELLARWPEAVTEFMLVVPSARAAADEELELSSAAG
jgi:glutamate synthase domain-containing protein 3